MTTKNYQHQCENKENGGFGSALYGLGYNKAVKLTVDWLEQQKELVGISFEKDFYERYRQFMNKQAQLWHYRQLRN